MLYISAIRQSSLQEYFEEKIAPKLKSKLNPRGLLGVTAAPAKSNQPSCLMFHNLTDPHVYDVQYPSEGSHLQLEPCINRSEWLLRKSQVKK